LIHSQSARAAPGECAVPTGAPRTGHDGFELLRPRPRPHDRILKVARTLADIEGQEKIASQHILEAIQYRTLDRNLWV